MGDMLASLMNETGDAVADYERLRPLIKIIESEDYLYCSDDANVKNKYIKLRERTRELYNRYMTIVR